jgi:hypothetical protein
MKRISKSRTGWLRSKEFTTLSLPLAALLILLFSLSIHINSALAAGSNSSICAASRIMSNVDGNKSSQLLQFDHCSICIVSLQYKSFGLSSDVVTINRRIIGKPVFPVSGKPDQFSVTRYSQIRAPPFS